MTLKIKFKIVAYFLSPEKWLFLVHVYHAMHHNLSTIYHHAALQNPQNPLQNTHSTTPNLILHKTKNNN